MNKLLATAAAFGMTFAAAQAHAVALAPSQCGCESPLGGSFAVSIWSADTAVTSTAPGAFLPGLFLPGLFLPGFTLPGIYLPGLTTTVTPPGSAAALPTNPIVSGPNLISTGIYKGNLDFSYASLTPTVAGFLASGSGLNADHGTYGGTGTNVSLTSAASRVTLFEFSFTIKRPLTGITITHDDGVSLFAAGAPSTNLLPSGASSSTGTTVDTLPSLAAGTYNLWFADANGASATLCFDPINDGTATVPTPEPASMALLGVGLATVGFARRRRA